MKNLTLCQPSWILYDHLFQTCFLKMNVIQSIEILYAYRFSHTGDTQESFRRYCLNEKKKIIRVHILLRGMNIEVCKKLITFLNRLSLVQFPTDFQSQQISDQFIKRQIQQYQTHGNSFVRSAKVERLKKGVSATF